MISDLARSARTLADRYERIELVGRGGMGEVWAGRDLESGVRERFEAEAVRP